MFVDKGGQGSVILFAESIRSLGWIINQFTSKEICFHFLFINFLGYTKGNSSISSGTRDKKFTVKLTEKWSEKASVVWPLEILSLLDLVKTRSRVCLLICVRS